MGLACCDARLVPLVATRGWSRHAGRTDISARLTPRRRLRWPTGSSTDYYWDIDVFNHKLGQDILARASSSASHRRGDKTFRR
jgi:hypothetical protein